MRWILTVVCAAVFFINSPAHAKDIPKLNARVMDLANILKPNERAELENYLASEESKTSNQIVVFTVESLNGEDMMPYVQKVFREWKLGTKEKDNGVIFFIALKDRKMRIHTGRGLEGALPDGLCGQILDDEVRPLFKESKFSEGVTTGVQKIVGAIHGEYKAKPKSALQKMSREGWLLYGVLLFILYFVCAAISEDPSLVGGIVGGIGASLITLMFLTVGFAIFAFILGFIIGAIARIAGNTVVEIAGDVSSSSGSRGSGSSSYSGGGGTSGGGGASSSW